MKTTEEILGSGRIIAADTGFDGGRGIARRYAAEDSDGVHRPAAGSIPAGRASTKPGSKRLPGKVFSLDRALVVRRSVLSSISFCTRTLFYHPPSMYKRLRRGTAWKELRYKMNLEIHTSIRQKMDAVRPCDAILPVGNDKLVKNRPAPTDPYGQDAERSSLLWIG